MPESNASNDKAVNAVKAYLTPILIAVIGTFIWRDLSEMRSDVRLLLTNQSANQVKIETLQTDVSSLKEDLSDVKSFVYGQDYIEGTQTKFNFTRQPAKKEDEHKIRKR